MICATYFISYFYQRGIFGHEYFEQILSYFTFKCTFNATKDIRKKNRQMTVGLNKKYDMPKSSDLVQV